MEPTGWRHRQHLDRRHERHDPLRRVGGQPLLPAGAADVADPPDAPADARVEGALQGLPKLRQVPPADEQPGDPHRTRDCHLLAPRNAALRRCRFAPLRTSAFTPVALRRRRFAPLHTSAFTPVLTPAPSHPRSHHLGVRTRALAPALAPPRSHPLSQLCSHSAGTPVFTPSAHLLFTPVLTLVCTTLSALYHPYTHTCAHPAWTPAQAPSPRRMGSVTAMASRRRRGSTSTILAQRCAPCSSSSLGAGAHPRPAHPLALALLNYCTTLPPPRISTCVGTTVLFYYSTPAPHTHLRWNYCTTVLLYPRPAHSPALALLYYYTDVPPPRTTTRVSATAPATAPAAASSLPPAPPLWPPPPPSR